MGMAAAEDVAMTETVETIVAEVMIEPGEVARGMIEGVATAGEMIEAVVMTGGVVATDGMNGLVVMTGGVAIPGPPIVAVATIAAVTATAGENQRPVEEQPAARGGLTTRSPLRVSVIDLVTALRCGLDVPFEP